MSNISEQSLSGFKWSAIGEATTRIIHFGLGLIIARILDPEDFGIIGMVAIFLAISQLFADCGFENALIRKTDRSKIDCSTVFLTNIGIGLLVYAILYMAAPYIASFYNMPALTNVVRVMSISVLINSAGIVPRALRTIAVDFKSQAYASIISSLISGVIGLALALCGYRVWAIVWQTITCALLSVIMMWIFARWVPSFVFSRKSFLAMFSYGSKLLASRLIHTIYRHASSLVIGKFYTPADLGYYDRGYQIGALPSVQFSTMLNKVTFPILSKHQQDNAKLLYIYRKYLAMTSMAVFFIMILLAVLAKPLIVVLLTEKWIGAVPFLQVFCLALMFDSICVLNNNMILVKGWSGLFFKLEIIKKILIIPILLLSIPLGVLAICSVVVVHTFLDIILSNYYIRKLLGVEGQQYSMIAKYITLSIIACAPAFVMCGFDMSPWLAIGLGTISAVTLYLWMLHRDENMRFLFHFISVHSRL